MLAALALALGVSLVAWIWGRAALRAVCRLSGVPATPLPDAPVVALTGLGVLAAGAGTLALFCPLGAGALAAVLAGSALLALADRRAFAADLAAVGRSAAGIVRNAGRSGRAALAFAALLGLARTALPVANYDTGAYHAQILHWLEVYGFVPGLANLHDRLAFSASWLVPNALFGLAFLGRPLHILNGILFLLLLAWAAGALADWRAGERRASRMLRLALPVAAFALFDRWLSSPTPDVAAAALSWVVAVLVLEQIEEGRSAEPGPAFAAAALLAAFAAAVKLSALPALLLPALLAVRQLTAPRVRDPEALPPSSDIPSRRRPPLVAAAAVLLLLAPGIAQTAVTTGYLVFPVPGLPPLDVDWALPARLVERQARWIASWARVPHRPTQVVEAMSAREWMALWWEHLPTAAQATLVAVAVLAPLRFGRRLAGRPSDWADRADRRAENERLALAACLLAGAVYWFALAPDPRFGWGSLLPLALLLALDTMPRRAGSGGTRRTAALPALLLFIAFAGQAWQIHGWEPQAFPTAARQWLLPAPYPRPPRLKEVPVGPLHLQVPVLNDRCWYHPFPCAPRPDPRLEPRGLDLNDGFRIQERPTPPPPPPSREPAPP